MSNFKGWTQHPCTIEFRKEVKKAVQDMYEAPRLMTGSVDETALMNAKVAGFLEGLEEIDQIINDLLEDSTDD